MKSKTCPACGADAPADALQCAFCGSPLVPVSLSIQQRGEVTQFIRDQNTRLLQKRKALLRQVDLLGTLAALGGMAVIWVVMIGLQLSNSKSWLLIYLAAVLTGWWVMRRRRLVNGLIAFYRQEVDPQVAQYTDKLGLPRWQFDQTAARELPPNAPLRKFMFLRSGSRD